MQEICKGFVQFQGEMLRIEELSGMNQQLIFFNPQEEGHKIQITEKVYLQFDGDSKFIKILDNEKHFFMINSNGETIADSNDLKPEFITAMIEKLEGQSGEVPTCMN